MHAVHVAAGLYCCEPMPTYPFDLAAAFLVFGSAAGGFCTGGGNFFTFGFRGLGAEIIKCDK